MGLRARGFYGVLAASLFVTLTVSAELSPEKIRTADGKKTQTYLRDGMVVGGDSAINSVVVRDIRRALNPAGFERIVVDLLGNRDGEAVAIPRPPYFQVAVNGDERRVVISVFGNPKLDFNQSAVLQAFTKSRVVEKVTFLPVLDSDLWTFVLEMKSTYLVEVFELTDPVRLIIDVKTPVKMAPPIKKTTQRPAAKRVSTIEAALEESEETEAP